MNKTIKSLLRRAGLYRYYQNWSMKRRQRKEFREWEKGERDAPPHLIKQKVLREYGEKYNLRILVETGTLHGDMIEAMKDSFDKVYSIELSEELYMEAKERFVHDSNVELIQGDSGTELAKLVDRLDGRALFWLDGHYSGGYTARGEEDTPIYKELASILDSPEVKHVIIIDDARCFGTDPAYPSLEEVKRIVSSKRNGMLVEVEGDSIRITPAVGLDLKKG